MRVLILCEFSGTMRDAFIARGHDAVSLDILPTDKPGPHIVGDALAHLASVPDNHYDLIIAHPPCTYLANSGVGRMMDKNGNIKDEARWSEMLRGGAFFRSILNTKKAKRIAVENPIPHRYAVTTIGRTYDCKVQPWMFGHPESKATCFWLVNLPPLQASNIVCGRKQRLQKIVGKSAPRLIKGSRKLVPISGDHSSPESRHVCSI